MSFLVDTSVWSLAFRRDSPPDHAAVSRLRAALERNEELFEFTTLLDDNAKTRDSALRHARSRRFFTLLPNFTEFDRRNVRPGGNPQAATPSADGLV